MTATPPDAPRARLLLRIRGRVQGVGFRYSAAEHARRLGLTGWVRNTRGGDVELVAEGPEEPLRRLLAWSRSGPPAAAVSAVEPQWLPYTGEFDDFHISP